VAALVAACTAMVMVVVGMPAASAAAGYVVTGRLVSDDGKPLAGLKVRAVPAAGYGSVGSSKTVTTNAKGDFRLPMPKAGSRFLLEAFDPARTATADEAGECVEPARTTVLTTFIGSRGKQTFTDLDPITGYKARKSSHIRSGTHQLTASSGFDLTVAGMERSEYEVEVLREDGELAYGRAPFSAGPDCGALDHGFIPGRYTVVVSTNGYESVRFSSTLARGEVERREVAFSRRTATLAVTAQYKGEPGLGVVRGVAGDQQIIFQSNSSEQRGRYTATVPTGVPVRVTYEPLDDNVGSLGGTTVTLQPGEARELTLSEQPTAQEGLVRGRFVVPGKDSRRTAELRTMSGDVVAEAKMWDRDVFLLGAPPGMYRLVYTSDVHNAFSYTTVRVTAGQTTQLGNVSATRKGVKLYFDVPKSGAKLDIRVLEGKGAVQSSVSGGRYRLYVIPGTYKLEFVRAGHLSKVVTVKARSTKRLTPPKLLKMGAVHGTIVYARNGKAVPKDAMVDATMTSKRTGDIKSRSTKDFDASFTIPKRAVPAGRYAVDLDSPPTSQRCGVWVFEMEQPCYPAEGVNSWRSPYFWDGREVFRLKGGSNDLGKVEVHLRGGL